MTYAGFGVILATMAAYARNRAEERTDNLGKQNTELLYAIGHILQKGAEECLRQAKEEPDAAEIVE